MRHDEAAASPWVIVKDKGGVEHYARLGAGDALLKAGKEIAL